MQEQLYRTFHDVEAHHWWMVARREIILSVARARFRPGASLLDIGCGTGAFLEAARPHFAVSGLDIAPQAVAFCHERGLAEVFEGSAMDLGKVAGRVFDGILLLDVIEHLEDDFSALRKARELLADDGRLLITVPAFMWFWSEHDEVNQHKRRYTAVQLRNLLRDTGFTAEKLSYYNSFLFPVAVAVRAWQAVWGIKASEYDYRPGLANSLLRWIFSLEKHVLPRWNFPFGVSLIAVARKTTAADARPAETPRPPPA